MTEGKRNQKQEGSEVKTFRVPFALGEIKENISIPSNSKTKPSKEQIIDQAFKFHSQGNIQKAAKLYQYFIDKGFNDHRVFTNYGAILKNLGKSEEAEILYRKAIKLNPDYPKAHSNLGNILRDLGRLKEAELSQRKAIELNPEFAMAHSNLGSILNDLGRLKEAELSQRKAIELNPNLTEAHYNLGNILRDLGKLKEAELSQRKAIILNPNLTEAHYNLGNILRDLGKLEEAELSQRRAIELNPDYAMAHSNLGSILRDLGRLEEAELSTLKAIEIKPDFAMAHSNLGSILRDLGKLKEAELSQRKAIQLDPDNQNIKVNLLNLLTIYEVKNINSNPLYIIDKEFRDLILRKQDNYLITDLEAIQLYKDGLEIYRRYNLDLETSLSQVYKCNEINLNCKRHMLIFKQHKIIPEFCFGCYKVQVEVNSIIELIKLFLVFNTLELKNYNTRKCMVELRTNVSGFYKGLIYCLGLSEALEISKELNLHIQNNIRIDLISKVKRGCSEYPLEFPKYKEINISGDQPMNYNENWRSIEKEIDQGNKNWGKSTKSIEGFNLNNFLVIRNWIAYAQKIGDQSVNKITNEQIKGPKILNYLNRGFHSNQNQKTTI
ncbi:tetratricopeptide repeat protein [Prochlorococcus marinus]|uniref:tetratricopeptide repeat protein n=1 Tax=Prochlorococcus marinus TaxID=1219 RepID=UPI0022B546C5|nr:tetratricopeptide repeat protein [Prochlorococcus marinus]